MPGPRARRHTQVCQAPGGRKALRPWPPALLGPSAGSAFLSVSCFRWVTWAAPRAGSSRLRTECLCYPRPPDRPPPRKAVCGGDRGAKGLEGAGGSRIWSPRAVTTGDGAGPVDEDETRGPGCMSHHKGGPGSKGLLRPAHLPPTFVHPVSDSHLISFTTSKCELLVTMVPFTCGRTNAGVTRMDVGSFRGSDAFTKPVSGAPRPAGRCESAPVHMAVRSVFAAGPRPCPAGLLPTGGLRRCLA